METDAQHCSRNEEWELVCRVAASPRFKKSARLRNLLLFLAERGVQSPGSEIHEQEIGCNVFGRDAGYDTSNDNIARVSASLLRKRLDEYFAAEGQNEPIAVRIPRGSYHLVFERIETPPAVELQEPAPALAAQPASHRLRVPLTFGAGVLSVIAILLLWRAFGNGAVRPSPGTPALSRFWSAVLDHHERAGIVVADAAVTFVEDVTRHSISLDRYMRRDFLSDLNPADRQRVRDLELLVNRPLTTLADVALLKRITDASTGHKTRFATHFCRDLAMRDFKTNSVLVLLGSKRGNPWVQLFEPRMNFRFEFDDPSGRAQIRNFAPLRGEQAVYARGGESGSTDEIYSVVAFLPNVDGAGSVLLLFGTAMEGTEAAGDYVTDETSCGQLLKRLDFERTHSLRPFEALLKSRRIGGVPKDIELISYRSK